MKKIFDSIGFACDLLPGILLAAAGFGVIYGATTGVLWM
jgi:hypothetical protein